MPPPPPRRRQMMTLPSDTVNRLRSAAREAPTAKLRRVWMESAAAREAWLPACLEAACERAISDDGDFRTACELAVLGEAHAAACGYPVHEFRRLQALALARSGATAEALERMEKLIEGAEAGALSYGLLARTYRDLAKSCEEPEERASLFLKAAEWSERGFREAPCEETLENLTHRAYLANQVAQFSFLGGEADRSEGFRKTVLSIYETIRTSENRWFPLDPETDFWWLTNLAEMALIDGDLDSAEDNYRRMRSLGDNMLGHVAANAKVCRMLLSGLGRDPHELDPVFELPSILVFSGHTFDPPDQETPRFPASRANAMKSSLGGTLARLDCFEGFVSASAGADLLFAEALLDRGGRLTVVLPFDLAETRNRCLEPWGQEWAGRFDRVLERAYRVREPEGAEHDPDNPADAARPGDPDDPFARANLRMLSAARSRAEAFELELRPLVVWDEADAESPLPGGTGDFAALCRRDGLEPVIVPLPRIETRRDRPKNA